MKKNLSAVIAGLALFVINPADVAAQEKPAADVVYSPAVENYNYVFGTQTVGPAYKFTDETKLVESARRIREMGSNILKISLDPAKYSDMPFNKDASMVEVLQQEPSYVKVMAMDFNYYFLWAYTPGVNWFDGLDDTEKKAEYKSLYDLTLYLLNKYNNSGKSFYLGHWEGDWMLLDNFNPFQQRVDSVKMKGMTDWYNVRQQAIEDALAKTTYKNINVYQYAELAEINGSMRSGYDRVINKIVPFTKVDFISYSSYVSTNVGEYAGLNKELKTALDYIEKNLNHKPSIKGKRVFIGEYGYPRIYIGSDEEQNRRTKLVMKTALEWGCPFVLYWEMYNNEIDRSGNQIGYWMIDHLNQKLPIWYTHNNFYKQMKKWVNDYYVKNKSLPADAAFRKVALQFFK